jgi:hypothetical protein
MPAPTATVVNSGKGAVVTYAYSLARLSLLGH